MSPDSSGHAEPFRAAFRFVFSRWRREGSAAPLSAGLMLAAVLCDVGTPLLAGRLTDAVATGAPDAMTTALWLLGGMVGLGAAMARSYAALGATVHSRGASEREALTPGARSPR